MKTTITLNVNGGTHIVHVDPETPLLYILRNDLGLKGVKYGCGSEQCGACKVLIDGQAVPTCKLPVKNVIGTQIVTIEGLGTPEHLHPLQETFIEEQAVQCGYCTSGMITAAQGLLNRTRYPTDEEIRTGMAENLCRCGTHERVRRAIKLRIGRPDRDELYHVYTGSPTGEAWEVIDPENLPQSILQNPELDSWIRIDPNETITVFTGKVELGQGIKTALAQIAAEELDVMLERIRVARVDTDHSPDEGLTVGSMSLQSSGTAVRVAATEARQILLLIAFEELEAPLERLVVNDGTILDPVSGRSVTYWDLFGGQRFERFIHGIGRTKSSAEYTIVGQAAKRLDLVDKVTGSPCYVHDINLPGMLHARVVRPPHYKARLVSTDILAVQSLPGVVSVIQDGSFLAVLAQREEQAINAMEALRASTVWQGDPALPDPEKLYDLMLNQLSQDFLIVDGAAIGESIPKIQIPAEAAYTLNATYYRPYQMHASLGPSASAAQFVDGKLTIWVHTQGVFPIRSAIAQVIGMDEDDIRVIQTEGAGCYGHNGADDAALDAALLALRMPGVPILLKWMRSDELTWEPYGPAMILKMQGSLDSGGGIIDWNHDVWSYSHMGRPRPGGRTSGLLAAWHLAESFERTKPQPSNAPHVGGHRNADPLYALPKKRIVKHFLEDSPLRVSAMRGLGAYGNVFAIESFMDELAFAARADPIDFRLRHLKDERAWAVLRAAAKEAGWQSDQNLAEGKGRGVGFAQYKNRQCYCAVIVDLHVDKDSGKIHLDRATITAEAGQVVNPDGLSNQLEGGFIQSASWTLKEQVTFNEHGIVGQDWDSYPILRFEDVPVIHTSLINRPELPFLGSGEAAQGPTPAAIANAVFSAVGIRLRQIPFTPEKVKALLDEK